MPAIPCRVFYDYFPLFQPESLAAKGDEAASQLLDLLGWQHAKTGSKAAPFQQRFDVLGCALDLSETASSTLTLENKPGRDDRLVTLLQQTRGGWHADQASGTLGPRLAEICLWPFQREVLAPRLR